MAAPAIHPTPQLRVSVQDFANEIQRDLPRLLREHPSGIFISDLQNEYGESPSRCKVAIRILQEKHAITLHQADSRAYFFFPTSHQPNIPLLSLTDLQRSICIYLLTICKANATPTSIVHTNYAYLAKRLQCSNGGIKSALHRLEKLQYLTILQESQRGYADGLHLQLLRPILDLNLDSCNDSNSIV